ncbi:hypothetical protein FGU65_10505 [Methanoculleus sp. FWC-SCC1]|uniref:Uncharacterized protein n=1 Tax=Methanoculleus frigidifontis TaxID=2584085 RepID=A0ABT8MBK6_9EURY|nr:hypothetical protein [Methanoculleus sp. FWC-SCC1]MDN7025318.1 hypothetical protein [Methanoculleus sp. FWC-SCC1]
MIPLPNREITERHLRELENLRSNVREEIAREEQKQNSLLAYNEKLHWTGLFILAAVLGNVVFLLFLPQYMLYWIISSFILYMVNPFILMIPTERSKMSVPDPGAITEFVGLLRDIGIAKDSRSDQTKTIGKVLWDVFFINSQPLAIGFGLIYGINILFSLYSGFIAGSLEPGAAILITLQSLAIIVFYAAIWHMKPYHSRFSKSIIGMSQDARKKIRTGWRAGLRVVLLVGALGALSGILVISAMLLPGMTLNNFLDSIDYSLGWNILPTALIFLSQVIIARYLQGAYSKQLLLQIGDDKIQTLRDHLLTRLDGLAASVQGSGGADDSIAADIRAMSVGYLRLRVYKTEYHDLFGFFPVYLVVPDLQIILDRNTAAVRKADRDAGILELTHERAEQPPARTNQ